MKRLLVLIAALLAFSFAHAVVVDLNTATLEQLETVKGIGPVKAKAIVDYRAKNGPFKAVDDLQKVEGFGKKSVDKMRAELAIGAGKPGAKPVAAPATAGKK